MVQVDIFWSYGLGSGLALAAGNKIKQTSKEDIWTNSQFLLSLLWIALFFAPSGMYLLWAFPGWETMFVAQDHLSIPAWLVVLFCITNITQGILGYFVTAKLVLKEKKRAAIAQCVCSHAAMLFILIYGWDGTGYRRFLYAGDGRDWSSGAQFPLVTFFSSPVFYTLVAMGVILVPSYIYLISKLRA